ncbi:hypothetical protein PghCCS26_00550 [Paenibacillus glycanilyticus]|uniref:Uncharacterized protein n=1 Tax=Paenibacillus glycanilyticus TaxID=126569 RepID=A0ABQ6ND95_9BACL|nr:hypothetical protein [Paenibacillus glycanilyticus]GMK42928.1 hypothetical protein PghCCS26_00550 [Paenibacillus glycanilyticus]
MIRIWPMLVLVFVIIIAGCSSNKGDVAGDELYILEGYEEKLKALDLTEVAALPYFSSPFITVAEDQSGQQYAVLFDKSGEVRQERLSLEYEEIIDSLQRKGYKIDQAPNKLNLHLFEINHNLYWSYGDGEASVYLDGKGNEADPFKKEETN